MRGSDERPGSLFSYVDLEARVRVDHPLRVIRDLANATLDQLSGEFGKLYTDLAALRLLRRSSSERCCSMCSMGSVRSGI